MKIILIEDNPGDARLVQELLKEVRGTFTTQVAETCRQGMELLHAEAVDVVLLDLNLPDSRGIATLTDLETRFPQVPFVIMTSIDDEELARQAVRLGAQDYLVKGHATGELLRRTLLYAIERKRAAELLRESQKQNDFLANLLHSSSQPLGIGYPDGRLGLVNRAFEELTGYSADELRSIDWAETLTPSEWRELEQEKLAELNRTGRPIRYEKEYIKKDGTRIPIELLVHLAIGPEGKPEYYYSFVTDITERKRTEEALHKAHALLELRVQERTSELSILTETLEQRVSERMAELTMANEMLRASRLASLNLVEDAVAARKQTEETNVKLRREVEDRKRAEEAVRASEEQFRRAIEEAPIPVIMYAEDGQVLQISRSWTELTGYSISDVPTLDAWLTRAYGEGADDVRSHMHALFRGDKRTIDMEFPIRTLNGSTRYWSFSASSPGTLSDRRRFVVGMAVDITERKRAEESLGMSLGRFELLASTAGQLLQAAEPQREVEALCKRVMAYLDCHAFFNFLVDEKEGRLHLNACAGIPEEEAKKIEWLDFGTAVCGCVAKDGKRIVAEHIPTTPDERTELIKSYGIQAYCCHPLLGPGGKVIGTLSFGTCSRETFSDDDLSLMKAVTDQVATSMARKQAEDDILRLSEIMAARNLELESLNKELEAFNYSISHDLRAPIRSMAGFSKIIAEDYADKLDDQGKDYLTRIQNASDKMTHLIDDLLNLSRISRQPIDRVEIDLSKLAASVLHNLREAYAGRSVEVVVREGMRASVDPNLMRVVLTNLLDNAWKFTGKTENSRIEFGSLEKDGETVYFVRDNGAGFDQQYDYKIFWPFHRLHTDKEFPGTGIGLAIVDRIIRRHGGRIWAEGEVGKGATFAFTLG